MVERGRDLLIRGARQLITLRGVNTVRRGASLEDLSIIEDGALLIRDGRVAQVGSTRRIDNLKEIRGVPEIDVAGAIVLPGFVDPLLRMRADSPFTTSREKGPDFYHESLILMRSCLNHGTLNVQVCVGGDSSVYRSDLSALRSLARIGNQPIGIMRAWHASVSDSYLAAEPFDYERLLAFFKKRKLIQSIEVMAEASDARYRLRDAAIVSGLNINLLWLGGSPGVLSDILDHVQLQSVLCSPDLSDAECDVLARSPVPVVISPMMALTQEKVSGTIRKLAFKGAPLALGSGYNPHAMPVFNMQLAVSLAVLRYGLSPQQAIVAVTINAAHALNLGPLLGSLEIGKRADLLVMTLPDYREIPRRFGTNYVGMAIRGGEIAFNHAGWKVSRA
jgi:imidazolonepropionase